MVPRSEYGVSMHSFAVEVEYATCSIYTPGGFLAPACGQAGMCAAAVMYDLVVSCGSHVWSEEAAS